MSYSFLKLRARHLQLGRRGERFAVKLLQNKYYVILATNYRAASGEIDIVARDGATLVFVEVKTSAKSSKVRPGAGLTIRQQKRIRQSGKYYCRQIKNPEVIRRHDLVEVVIGRFNYLHELRHWVNHF